MRHEHPICINDLVICDLAKAIMNSKLNEPSPLENLEEMMIRAIGDMVGIKLLDKDFAARDRKKAAKHREIENAIVLYVTQNCSCYNDIQPHF